MYTILERYDDLVKIQFQEHVYNVPVSVNEDACIKLFIRKKVFGVFETPFNSLDHLLLGHLLKELDNVEYCQFDLINKYILQKQLKKIGLPYINSCLPTCEQDIINFITNGQYIVRPCIDSDCCKPYFNKLYSNASDLINDLNQWHRWKGIQESISFRERKTVHRFSKFLIQEYIPLTKFGRIIVDTSKNYQAPDVVNQFIKLLDIKDCILSIKLEQRDRLYIDHVSFLEVHDCLLEKLRIVNNNTF